MVVHGSPRTFMAFRDRFQDFGDAHNALILCPLFPVGPTATATPTATSISWNLACATTRSCSIWSPRWRSDGTSRAASLDCSASRAARNSSTASSSCGPSSLGDVDRRARFGDAAHRQLGLVGRRARPPGEARHRPEPRGVARCPGADPRRRGRSGDRRNHPSRRRPLLDGRRQYRGRHPRRNASKRFVSRLSAAACKSATRSSPVSATIPGRSSSAPSSFWPSNCPDGVHMQGAADA